MTKKNGKTKVLISVVGIIIVLAGIVMSIAKAYFILPIEVAHQTEAFKDFKEKDFVEMKKVNKEKHDEFEADIDACNNWMSGTGAELVGIKKDIGYLGNKIDDNILEQKAFQVEQRTMQKTILTKIEELKI